MERQLQTKKRHKEKERERRSLKIKRTDETSKHICVVHVTLYTEFV